MSNKLLLTAFAIALMHFSLFAQQISLSGYVRDAKTLQGIAGATVSLSSNKQIFSVTDSAGHYAISIAGARNSNTNRSCFTSPRFVNNALLFSVAAAGTNVRVEAFTIGGRFVAALLNASCDAGDYSLRPSLKGLSCQVYVLKVRIGPNVSLLAMKVQDPEKSRASSVLERSHASKVGQGTLNKTSLADVLFAAAPGYDTGYQQIASYSGTVDFLLDKKLVVMQSINYRLEGKNIIIIHAYEITRYSYCTGDKLTEYYDTIQPGYDTTEFANSGDSLWLIMDPETTYTTHTAYQSELVFVRSGTGAGIVGTWKPVGAAYRILSGAFSEEERHALDSANAAQVSTYDSMSVVYVFTGAKVELGFLGGYNFAKWFIGTWNSPTWNGDPADSAQYAISVAAVSSTKVTLTGRKTGEIVTLTWPADSIVMDLTYTSSNPAHGSRTVYQSPTTCPNAAPDWWTAFLADNQKTGLPKRLAKTAVHAFWKGHLFAFPYLINK